MKRISIYDFSWTHVIGLLRILAIRYIPFEELRTKNFLPASKSTMTPLLKELIRTFPNMCSTFVLICRSSRRSFFDTKQIPTSLFLHMYQTGACLSTEEAFCKGITALSPIVSSVQLAQQPLE